MEVLSEVVGLSLVFQQIPFVIMSAPPSDVIVPPEMAVVAVTSVIGVVVIEGATFFFSHEINEMNKSSTTVILYNVFITG